ncbi:hypothetical protein CEUSTIGMA_g24.t1 [Chlamydomonas eustigma]|uniref:Uncharacterized protein n=1 Tax=Chlamydomonas eustigma TaxID=1157962 RepID=A0A250WP22_9CHLO|nr:hypothetical protein CEUSTIGMA_g24.t1 [Chlamydomonas eustigma]|eukprot:GAX72568.1 hypothetical protein CEUSTIGMA_g24.t1 [Chlamydomonas eustigma]
MHHIFLKPPQGGEDGVGMFSLKSGISRKTDPGCGFCCAGSTDVLLLLDPPMDILKRRLATRSPLVCINNNSGSSSRMMPLHHHSSVLRQQPHFMPPSLLASQLAALELPSYGFAWESAPCSFKPGGSTPCNLNPGQSAPCSFKPGGSTPCNLNSEGLSAKPTMQSDYNDDSLDILDSPSHVSEHPAVSTGLLCLRPNMLLKITGTASWCTANGDSYSSCFPTADQCVELILKAAAL